MITILLNIYRMRLKHVAFCITCNIAHTQCRIISYQPSVGNVGTASSSTLTSTRPCKMWLCIALVGWLQRAYSCTFSASKSCRTALVRAAVFHLACLHLPVTQQIVEAAVVASRGWHPGNSETTVSCFCNISVV